MTFGERRKRADIDKIVHDMDTVESAFLSKAQKLNKKRQELLVKRVQKMLPELLTAHERGDKTEVEGILQTLQMPSQKEYRKLIEGLVVSSTKAGILRAHFELLRLKELYEFWEVNPVEEGYDYDVVFPKEAQEFLDKYSLEISVITEDTVLDRIRKELNRGLEEGLNDRDLIANIKATAGTWMSDRHAETIARTENGKMYNAGRLARWLDPEINGFVEALQYDAIVDKRTTEICNHLDGKVIAITDEKTIAEYTPPNHFQCRATWLPVTRYEDWKPDFDTSVKPEKGFTFTSPMPKLLQGKTEPLVQPKRKVDLLTVTDPDIIRSLPDKDFETAIRNIQNQSLKLSMVKERAEQMLVRDNGLKEVLHNSDFMLWSYDEKKMSAEFEWYGGYYPMVYEPAYEGTLKKWAEEMYQFKKEPDKQLQLMKKFADKHADNIHMSDVVATLRDAVKDAKASHATWKGLNPIENRSASAEKLLTIKRPPMGGYYKEAVGLQYALEKGQEWIKKYVPNQLQPSTGIQMKFQHNLRRAYAQGNQGTIHFGKWEDDAGVIVHEVGHVLHWNNREVADLVHEFFMQRTENLQMRMDLYNDEDVIRDSFYNPYVGRIYKFERHYKGYSKYSTHGIYGQEVLSMGLQAMYTDPMKFYREDKEHFLLTYAILRRLF